MSITFPTTPGAFIEYQETGIGRKLEGFERKIADAVVDLANGSYQDGAQGEENFTTMEMVRKFYAERGKNINSVTYIWESICWWCDEAYRQGKEARQHG